MSVFVFGAAGRYEKSFPHASQEFHPWPPLTPLTPCRPNRCLISCLILCLVLVLIVCNFTCFGSEKGVVASSMEDAAQEFNLSLTVCTSNRCVIPATHREVSRRQPTDTAGEGLSHKPIPRNGQRVPGRRAPLLGVGCSRLGQPPPHWNRKVLCSLPGSRCEAGHGDHFDNEFMLVGFGGVCRHDMDFFVYICSC